MRVTEHIPGRHKYLTVTGWEPLGNLCASDSAKSEATPYCSVEPQCGTATWHGTWGHHYFTFSNLLNRASARWNMFSGDWESFDYVAFLGGTIRIPQTSTATWMITFDEYLQTAQTKWNEKNKEDHWGHPGILLNVPKTHIIFPTWNYRHRKMYKIRITPPPGWKGVQRFPEAMSYICMHWLWTYCDFEHAFYDNICKSNSTDTCQVAPWWAQNNMLDKWVDRTKYPASTSCGSGTDKNWGPFLPQRFAPQAHESSLFFLYKLRFKLVGSAIWRPLPRIFQAEGLVPDPEGPPAQQSLEGQDESEAEQPPHKKSKRPLSTYDIWGQDLDSDGFIKERAFRRITGYNPRDEQHTLARRLRSLHDKLHDVLGNRGLLRQRL